MNAFYCRNKIDVLWDNGSLQEKGQPIKLTVHKAGKDWDILSTEMTDAIEESRNPGMDTFIVAIKFKNSPVRRNPLQNYRC